MDDTQIILLRLESRSIFRTIRKKKNELDISAAEDLLQYSRRGVLAVNREGGYRLCRVRLCSADAI